MNSSGFTASAIAVGVFGLAFLAGTDSRGLGIGALDALARAVFWALLLVASARLSARAVGSRLTGLAHLVWDGAAGLALVMAVVLAAGLLPGGFRPWTVRLVLAAIVALAVLVARADPIARFRNPDPLDGPARGLVLLLVTLTVVVLPWDRVPPVFFDSRAYHFAMPELWLVNGRIAPESWSLHSWFPPGMSVLYGVGLATGGETWANDANLLVGLCLVGGAFDLGRRFFGGIGGLLAAGLVSASPVVLYALALPAADLGHGLFVFGALACLLLRSADHPCWIRRASVLTGGALLTKYLGFVVPLAFGTAWLVLQSRSQAWRERVGQVLRFATPAVLLLLPWLAANAMTVGNPIAPVASSVISTRGLAPGGEEVFRGDARGGLPGWADVRMLPQRWITGSKDDSRLYPTPALGWLPIVLLPLAIAASRDDRNDRMMLGLTSVLLLVWFATFRWERFLVASTTVLAVALAGGVVAATKRAGPLRILPVVAALVAVAAVPIPIVEILRFDNGLRVASGLQSAREFVEGGLPSVRLFHRVDDLLDPGRDRVLLVGEMRHYGLSVPRCAPTGFNTHALVQSLRDDPDPRTANAALREQGFTHLIFDSGWVARSAAQYPSLAYLGEHPDVLKTYLATLGAPLASEGSIALFKIPD